MKRKLTLATLILLLPLTICVQQTQADPVPIANIKVAFCPSWGSSTDSSLIYTTLANNWSLYGDYSLEFIDVTAPVTYEKLVATAADVVIVCNPGGGTTQYSQSEADAIQEFLLSGNKGIFMSYLLKWTTYDNSFLAPLVGVKSSTLYNNSRSHNNIYDLYEPNHPIFANVSDPWNSGGYIFSQNITVPSWSDTIFPGTEIVAETTDSNSAVIAYDNLWRGVWATSMVDFNGNEEDKQFVYNSILWLRARDTTAPNITSITQMPLPDNVLINDEVQTNATIIDSTSGVKQATLTYAYTNGSGSWIKSIDMTHVGGNIWNATIPAFPYGTRVSYIILAEDNAGNTVSSEELGYEPQYQVIPEFSTWASMSLIFVLLTVAIAITKRKTFKTQIR